jgi:hypothetical protein
MKSGLNDKTFVKILPKFIHTLLPDGVVDIEYDIEPIEKDEYYLNVTFIVPDDSPLLIIKNELLMMRERIEMREELKRKILGFFGKRVIINSTGIRAESFHRQHKINLSK